VLQDPFKNKRRVLEEFLEDADVGLESSVGVGDTLSDVGFLEMVRTPIAFNPNRSFFEMARQRGWAIVVERKDVIYNLQKRLEDPVLKEGTEWVG
jgi:phosphoserine phosphatase